VCKVCHAASHTLATDRELEREVALKVIRSDMATNPEILKRFKQELILARQITHKNVIRIFDLGQSDGIKFITMEYIEGEDLQSVLKRKRKRVSLIWANRSVSAQ
jgi:serine/threonine protein kinase